jgi:hypothetical protein
MSEEDLKSIITSYQQKAFELFNQNIVFETQINTMKKTISSLNAELEKLKNSKTRKKAEEEFQ